MTLDVEGVVDGAVGGGEALSLSLGLESLHLPFSSSDGKVGVLDPVVVSQSSGLVAILAAKLAQRRLVGSQAVGDDCVRYVGDCLIGIDDADVPFQVMARH